MHRPHILILTPTDLTVEVPAYQTVDVDKGVAVDNDATHRFADGHDLTSLGVFRLEFHTCDPSIRSVAFNPPLTMSESYRVPVASQEAIGDRVGLGLGVRHC